MSNSNNKIIGFKPPTTDHSAASTEEFWTEERRRSVKPIPMPATPKQEDHVAEVPQPQGEPGHTPHGQGAAKEPKPPVGPRGTGGQAVPTPLVYPYRTCGRLFGTLPAGGGGFSGSASLISPNVLLTAGHCVFYNGGWNGNLAFYPSYPVRPSTDPEYKFNYSYLACWTAWSQKSNFAYDYGMIWIDSGPGNQLGWLGTLWNASTANRTWDAIGYPAEPNPPFNGNAMDQAAGQYGGSDVSGTFILTNDNMSHGASGGPWITTWNEPTPTHANSVSSNIDGKNAISGPYFTQDLNNLFNWISNPANRK